VRPSPDPGVSTMPTEGHRVAMRMEGASDVPAPRGSIARWLRGGRLAQPVDGYERPGKNTLAGALSIRWLARPASGTLGSVLAPPSRAAAPFPGS